MTEYFIYASFAAPFFGDTSEAFLEAETPDAALEAFAASYSHPAGLYAASAYESADAYHKGQPALAQWLCNHELAKRDLTADSRSYSYLGHAPGDFELNGVRHKIENPKQGQVVKS